MSDAGVSMHVAQLRKELDDQLFARTAAGLAFTPGGLRLASRAIEILGLQQQTAIEVTEAAHGRRLLRIAASSAFAEHAAPGLIELFSSRANDLSVELSVHPDEPVSRADHFARRGYRARSRCRQRHVRRVDRRPAVPEVSDPHRRRTRQPTRRAILRPPPCCATNSGCSGPSAGSSDGEIAAMLRDLAIPESQQRIFQSDAAALEEVQRVGGVTLAIGFSVGKGPSGRTADPCQGARPSGARANGAR